MLKPVTIETAVVQDTDQILSLVTELETKWYSLDSRMPIIYDSKNLTASLFKEDYEANPPLIARDENNSIVGLALSSLWELSSRDEMLAFFMSRNAVLRYLALSAQNFDVAERIFDSFFTRLDNRWREQKVQVSVMSCHSQDHWTNLLAKNRGFVVESYIAFRAADPLPFSPSSLQGLRIRRACPADKFLLLELYMDEIRFHTLHSPFTQLVVGMDESFLRRIEPVLEESASSTNSAVILVAEHLGRIVGMIDTVVVHQLELHYIDILVSGEIGFINNTSVHPEYRGKGVGKQLVCELLQIHAERHLRGYFLNFSAFNPLSRGFWPHLGFLPVRTIYQRRY